MNEDQLLEVFNAIQDQTGFSLGKFDKFSSAMQDPQKAGQIFDAIQNQTGFSLGKRDRFIFKPTTQVKQEQTSPEQKEYQYSWGPDRSDVLENPAYAVTTGEITSKEGQDAILKRVRQTAEAERPVRGEVERIDPTVPVVGTLPVVNEFVQKQFKSETPQVQEAVSRYLAEQPNVAALIQNETLSEKQMAGYVETALWKDLGRAFQDYQTLTSRLELSDNNRLQELVTLMSYEPQNEQEAQALDQKIKEFEGTDELKYLQTLNEVEARRAQYKDIIRRYPEELKRREDLKARLESIKIKEGDSTPQKAWKLAKNTAGAVGNAGIDWVISMVNTSKAGSDLLQSTWRDVDTLDNSDKVAESITGWLDSKKFAEDTDFETTPENFLPAAAKTITDMALLFIGSKGMGGVGKKGANFLRKDLGMVVAGLNATWGNTYEAMKEAGLDDNLAARYSFAAAFAQGALERVSPQLNTRKILYGDIISKLGKEASLSDVLKMAFKDVPAENVQEMLQSLSDAGINQLVNAGHGTELDGTITGRDVFETVALTTTATVFMGGLSGKQAFKGKQKEAAQYLLERKDDFRGWLRQQLDNGNMTADEAANALVELEKAEPSPVEKAAAMLESDPEKVVSGETTMEEAETPSLEPEKGEKVTYGGQQFTVAKKSRGKLTLQSEDGNTVVRDVPMFEVERESGPTVLTADEFKKRNNENNKQRGAQGEQQTTAQKPKSNKAKTEGSKGTRTSTKGGKGKSVRRPKDVKKASTEELKAIDEEGGADLTDQEYEEVLNELESRDTQVEESDQIVDITDQGEAVDQRSDAQLKLDKWESENQDTIKGLPRAEANKMAAEIYDAYEKGASDKEISKIANKYTSKEIRKEEGKVIPPANGEKLLWEGKEATVKDNKKTVRLVFSDGTPDKVIKKGVRNNKKLANARAEYQATQTTVDNTVTTNVDPDDWSNLTEVDRSPKVGDIMEVDGVNYEVTKVANGKFDGRSQDRKGGVKRITKSEISKVYEKNTGTNPEAVEGTLASPTGVQSTQQNAEQGVQSAILGNKRVEVIGRTPDGKGYRVRLPNQVITSVTSEAGIKTLEDALNLTKQYDDAKAELKDTLTPKLKAVYDPKNEAEEIMRTFRALKNYIKAWVALNGRQGLSELIRRDSDVRRLKEELGIGFIRAAYNDEDTPYGEAVEAEKAKEAKEGNKKRKSVKQFQKAKAEGKNVLDEEILTAIQEKGLKYFTEPLSVTDAAVEALFEAKPIETVLDQFLNDTGQLTPAMRTLLGIKLLKRYNQLAQNPNNRKENQTKKAIAVAETLVELGTEYGRAINAFKALTLLHPEGVQMWATENVSKVKEALRERHKQAIARVEDLFDDSRAEALAEIPVSQYGIKDLQKKKKEALKRFRDKVRGQAGSFPNPSALKDLLEYGFYVVAEGVNSLNRFIKKMKDVGVDEKTATTIWDTKVNGQKLSDHAGGAHLKEIRDALGSPKLEEVLEKYGYSKDTATEFNKLYAKKLKERMEINRRKALRSIGIEGRIVANLMKKDSFTKDDIKQAMLDAVGFQQLDQQTLDDLGEYSKRMQAMPEGFLQNREAQEMANYLSQKMGKVNLKELGVSLWYASILSGLSTQSVNFGSNVLNTMFEVPISTLQDILTGKPGSAVRAFMAMGKGYRRGIKEAKAILWRGEAVNKNSSKFFEASPLESVTPAKMLEQVKKAKTPLDLLNALMATALSPAAYVAKVVPRVMSAVDTFFYYGLYNHRQENFARNESKRLAKRPSQRQSGETVSQAQKRIYRQMMGYPINGQTPFEAATIQAKQEAAELRRQGIKLNKNDINRRVYEIMEQTIDDPRVSIEADRFASRGTFNYPPEGIAGTAARGISNFTSKHNVFKFVVPFTNIVANVINQQLDYTPLGLARASVAAFKGETTEYVKGGKEAGMLAIKGMLGTMLMGFLALELWGDDDEEGGLPWISGRGPKDYGKLKQLYDRGWKPYSFRVGDTWYSYQYTPVALAMTVLGNAKDAIKYDKLGEKTVFKQIQASIGAMPAAFLEMSFLKGMAEFFTALSDENKTVSYFERFAARVPTSFVPNILNQIDKAWDPTIYEGRDFKEKMLKGVPWTRRGNKPSLNVFGEPVKRKVSGSALFLGWDRFVSKEEYSDKATELLAEKDVVVPGIASSTEINKIPLKDQPELLRDYRMIVGQLLKKNLETNFKVYDSDPNFDKLLPKVFKNLRDLVKAEYQSGLDTDMIVKKYGLVKY